MLTLTDNASTAVKELSERTLGAESTTGGLRIASAQDGFNVAVAAAPEPQDLVLENEGARVFLDEAASASIGDKILDAQKDDTGAIRFTLAPAV